MTAVNEFHLLAVLFGAAIVVRLGWAVAGLLLHKLFGLDVAPSLLLLPLIPMAAALGACAGDGDLPPPCNAESHGMVYSSTTAGGETVRLWCDGGDQWRRIEHGHCLGWDRSWGPCYENHYGSGTVTADIR